MIDEGLKYLIAQGVLGIMLAAAFWYILHIQKEHRKEMASKTTSQAEERKEWRQIAKDVVDMNKETAHAIREHTGVMASLKTLLETTREKK